MVAAQKGNENLVQFRNLLAWEFHQNDQTINELIT